jgi:hypothetical protein
VLGLAFGMILALSQVTSAAPAATTVDIAFDGYCDGMQLNIPSVGLGTSDTVDGHHTGCVSGGLAGTVSSNPRAARITTDYQDIFPTGLQFQVNVNQTWVIYSRSGDLITFINSGTWSYGTPPRGGAPAAGVNRSLAASAAPATTIDIAFDGYCDGMQLNIPSVGLGTSDTVDGHHTGCIIGGLHGTVSTSPRSAHITTDYGGGNLLHYQVNANQTWVVYGQSGDLITLINSGTWSHGTPPRGGAQASAIG